MSRPRHRRRFLLPEKFPHPDYPWTSWFYLCLAQETNEYYGDYFWVPHYAGGLQSPDAEGWLLEEMTDVVGNPKGFNEVVHWKLGEAQGPPSALLTIGEASVEVEVRGQPSPTMLGLQALPSVPDDILRSFAWDAFYAFTTQIPEQFSFGLALWELPELNKIPDLIKQWRGLFTGVMAFLRGIAGKHLGYSFGVKPVVSDLKAMAGLLYELQARLTHLRMTRGEVFECHHKKTVEMTIPGVSNLETRYHGDNVFDAVAMYCNGHHLGDQVVRHELKANAKVRNGLRGLDELENVIDAFGASIGLNNPQKILWEKIPFSFLFEWFVDVDNVLRDLANNPVASPFEGTLEIVEQSHSIETSCLSELKTWIPSTVISGGYSSSVRYGEVVMRRYSRHWGAAPLGDYIAVKGSLNKMQELLLGALAIQHTPQWRTAKKGRRTKRPKRSR